ncbi:MAG: ATP-binding protein, partial [Firmicutes bacterium]|nr:ATP-binding protein [Bacillota bacterium]
MPLFRKSHGQLAWDDVKELLDQGAPENELLDYKRDCPSRIEPTVAAMANTYGGDILIGVDEQADGIPVPAVAVKGVANAANLKQSVEQKNFSIQPPVLGLFVEVVPIPKDEHPDGRDDRSVLVIRIPQSDLLPHFVMGQGHFGRAGSHRRAYTDEHLSTARIEWLADRRRRHVEFRDELMQFVDGLQYGTVWRKVWCVPLFPMGSVWAGLDGSQIEGLCPRIREEFPNADPRVFEHYHSGRFRSRPVQHGWV